MEGPAVEAFYAMVSHDTYCQKLLESDTVDSQIFRDVLSALLPSSKPTFCACLACLATQQWDLVASKGRESTVKGKESAARGGAESGSMLVAPDVLITICWRIQEAVLVDLLSVCFCVCLYFLTNWGLLSTALNCLLLAFVTAHPAAPSHSAVSNLLKHL